ncbi:MAG: hypothetical protein LBT59_21885 [Clostridiales bacterium]|jgi:Mn-dependent DtxR family transcriptional regulator|nr:hypothetical protein [Clostridiales bacterium]
MEIKEVIKCPIYRQKVGKYTYIVKALSIWDKLKGRSVRKVIERIGTIDPDTGETYYTDKYIEELRKEGRPTENLKSWEDARRLKKYTTAQRCPDKNPVESEAGKLKKRN